MNTDAFGQIKENICFKITLGRAMNADAFGQMHLVIATNTDALRSSYEYRCF